MTSRHSVLRVHGPPMLVLLVLLQGEIPRVSLSRCFDGMGL